MKGSLSGREKNWPGRPRFFSTAGTSFGGRDLDGLKRAPVRVLFLFWTAID